MIAIAILLAIAALVAVFVWRSHHRIPTVQTTTVSLQKMRRVIVSSGDVRPIQRQLINPGDLPSPVQRLYVHVGEHVQKGQTLLQLNTASANAAVTQAEMALQQANLAYERALQGYQSAPGPLQALWLPQVDSTESAVVEAKQQLAQAQQQLAATVIKANFAGTILVATPDGIDASGNQSPIIELVGPGKQVVVELSEVDAVQTHPGMKVTMTSDAYPNATFVGKVTQVAPFASVSSSGSSQVQVLIQPSGQFPVPYGYQVNCQITSAATAPVPTVPYSALVQQGTNYDVYVIDHNRVRLIPVTLGITNDSAVQVVSGLKAGQVVVDNPPSGLVNGEAVNSQ